MTVLFFFFREVTESRRRLLCLFEFSEADGHNSKQSGTNLVSARNKVKAILKGENALGITLLIFMQVPVDDLGRDWSHLPPRRELR